MLGGRGEGRALEAHCEGNKLPSVRCNIPYSVWFVLKIVHLTAMTSKVINMNTNGKLASVPEVRALLVAPSFLNFFGLYLDTLLLDVQE